MNNLTATITSAFGAYASEVARVGAADPSLNYPEQLWAGWYAYMANDVLATGLMSLAVHEAVYFGRSLPWIIVDALPALFRRFKIQAGKMPSAKEQWECASLVLLSHFTVEILQIWFFHPICTYFGLEYGVPFPPVWKMAYQIAIFFILEDAWHYWTHRWMHESAFMYKSVHKIHHQYSAPFGLAAEYASPIEVMFLGLGTVGSPILYCAIFKDLHILTVYLWITCRLFQAIDAHSGYEFPWSLHHFLPFWAGADHHDVHHEKFVGNYSSSFRWWDYFMCTESGSAAFRMKRSAVAAEKAKKKAE